jgi:hypothetical protein
MSAKNPKYALEINIQAINNEYKNGKSMCSLAIKDLSTLVCDGTSTPPTPNSEERRQQMAKSAGQFFKVCTHR